MTLCIRNINLYHNSTRERLYTEFQTNDKPLCILGDGTCRDVASTGETMSAVQARQEEARRKRRRKRRSGSSVVSSCFQGKLEAQASSKKKRKRENSSAFSSIETCVIIRILS